MTTKKKTATTSTSSAAAAADTANEPRKLPRVEAIDVSDGAWALVDAGVHRWFGRAYDEGFLRWLEQHDDEPDVRAPPAVQLFPLYEIFLRSVETELGEGHALVAMPHSLMGVGAPALLTHSSLTLVRDMQASDQDYYRGLVATCEKQKTGIRAARLEAQRAEAAAAGAP